MRSASLTTQSRSGRYANSLEIHDAFRSGSRGEALRRSQSLRSGSRRTTPTQKDGECCVCFHVCVTCTPCGHPLCKICWDRLPRPCCPICRRDLPVSAAAIPIKHFDRSKMSPPILPELPQPGAQGSSPPTRRNGSQPSSPIILTDLRLPSRLAQQIRGFARMSHLPPNQFQDLLTCAENLRSHVSNSNDVVGSDAAVRARAYLSQLAAASLAKMTLKEIVVLIPGCASALGREELLRDVVIPGIQNGVLQSCQLCGTDANSLRWQEAEAFITNLMVVGQFDVFRHFTDDMSVYAARHVFDAVKLAPLERLPHVLRHADKLISPWPAAQTQYTLVLRHWLSTRLQQLVPRTSLDRDPPSPMGSKPGSVPVWKQVLWWLDVLRSVAALGLLEGTPLREICDRIQPLLMNEGIKVATSQAVLLSMQSPIGRHTSLGTIGHDITPDLLARELLTRPTTLRFMPSVPLILLDCPSDRNSAMESVTVNDSGLSCDTLGNQHRSIGRVTPAPTR